MKKKSFIIAIVGISLIIIGFVLYQGNFFKGDSSDSNPPINDNNSNNDNKDTKEETINFSGKYFDNDKELDIYQLNDYRLYFIINKKIIGRALINYREASGEANNKTYKLSLNNSVITIESNDANITGSYKNKSDLSLDEFYNITTGNIDLLTSEYNGAYSNDNIEVTMYQMNSNEVGAFIKKNSNKEFIKFKINSDKSLTSASNGKNYNISLEGTYGGYMTLTIDEAQEKLNFLGEIVEQSIFDLYIEYDS